jgi:hypothetical protein
MATKEYLTQRIDQLEAVCQRVLDAQAADQQTALDHVLKIARVNTAMVLQALKGECATMREAIAAMPAPCPDQADHAALRTLSAAHDAMQAEYERLREAVAALPPPCPDPAAHHSAPEPATSVDPVPSDG